MAANTICKNIFRLTITLNGHQSLSILLNIHYIIYWLNDPSKRDLTVQRN